MQRKWRALRVHRAKHVGSTPQFENQRSRIQCGGGRSLRGHAASQYQHIGAKPVDCVAGADARGHHLPITFRRPIAGNVADRSEDGAVGLAGGYIGAPPHRGAGLAVIAKSHIAFCSFAEIRISPPTYAVSGAQFESTNSFCLISALANDFCAVPVALAATA
jgi:hypothetical protein